MSTDLISKQALLQAINDRITDTTFKLLLVKVINSAPVVNGEAVAIDVNKMVDRFLGWKLPSDFSPDSGINFNKLPHLHDSHEWPIGTNLFTANQAKTMFEYCINYQSDFNLEYTAKRIRRLLNALDIPDPSDGNDNTLMGCLFSLLGKVCRKVESEQAIPAVEALREISNWLVYWPIATTQDMSESFEYMSKLASDALSAAPSAPIEVRDRNAQVLEAAIDAHLKAYSYVLDVEKDYREYGVGGGTYTEEAIAHANKELVDSIEALVKIRALIPSTQAPKESEEQGWL